MSPTRAIPHTSTRIVHRSVAEGRASGEGRVRAGDEQVDVGVVELVQEVVDPRRSGTQVVRGADPEQQDGREHVDGNGGAQADGGGDAPAGSGRGRTPGAQRRSAAIHAAAASGQRPHGLTSRRPAAARARQDPSAQCGRSGGHQSSRTPPRAPRAPSRGRGYKRKLRSRRFPNPRALPRSPRGNKVVGCCSSRGNNPPPCCVRSSRTDGPSARPCLGRQQPCGPWRPARRRRAHRWLSSPA